MYTLSLLISAIILATVSFLLLRVYLHPRTAAVVSFVKFGISVVYFLLIPVFGYGANKLGSEEMRLPITISDDITYFRWSTSVMDASWGPINTLFTETGRSVLASSVIGSHDFYPWWNLFTQSLFGQYYFSPVLGNIFISVIIAIYLMKLLGGLGKSRRYYSLFGVFFLLHWDLLAWSSFLNIKGTFAMFGAVVFLYHTIRFDIDFRRGSFVGHHIVMILAAVVLLYYTRYYIGILLIISVGLWAGFNIGEDRMGFILAAFAVISIFLWTTGLLPTSRIFSHVERWSQFSTFFIGFIQILSSPRPWGLEPNYVQLFLPAIFHWLLFPVTLAGAVRLALTDRYIQLIIIFATLLILVYSTTPKFQGPRQRYQLAYIISLSQFEILWYFRQRVTFEGGVRRVFNYG